MSSVRTVQTREQIILDHLPQVKSLAYRVHRRCPPNVALEDLISAGTVGLMQAVNRFDDRRNLKLKTLAEHRIRGAIIDYLRQLDPLPRAVRQFQRKRDAAESEFESRNSRKASDEELAAELGISVDKYRRLSGTVNAGSVVSLDSLARESGRPYEVGASAAGDRDQFLEIRIQAAIDSLPPRDRMIVIFLRSGMATEEIAARLAVSQGRISQIKKRAIQHLRFSLGVLLGDARMTRA